jgi:hypothetical protein
VKLRFRAWLLVALLAFTANFGVTVSRVAPPREPNAIVHVQRAVEEAQAELSLTPVQRRTRIEPTIAAEIRRAAAALIGPLFQRPPPAPLFLS